MGSESSSYQNCELEGVYTVSGERHWELHKGRTTDGCAVSVFLYGNVEENQDLIKSAAVVSV